MVSPVGMRWWRNFVRMAGWAVELISSDQCSATLSYGSGPFQPFISELLKYAVGLNLLALWHNRRRTEPSEGQSHQAVTNVQMRCGCWLKNTWTYSRLQAITGSRRRQFHLWMTFLNLKYIYVVHWFVGVLLSDSRFFHSCLPVPSSPMEEKMLFHLGR